jgi:molecular chaperone GrpE (heat shock protein)
MSPQPHPETLLQEPDFEIQMKSLAEEAQQFLGDRPGAGRKSSPSFLEFLRPLVQHMESLSRAMTENTMAISRLEEAAGAQAARLEETAGTQAGLPRMISSIHDSIEQKNRLSQRLFDALHDELRSYKDSFLLDVFHRPIARDLITLFDDLSELHRQTTTLISEQEHVTTPGNGHGAHGLDRLKTIATNMDHIVHFVLEILARMEIQRVEPCTGKLDKQRQRVVSLERAVTPEEDLQISASLKPGFIWRERMLRPEEVVVKKWKETTAPAGALMNSQK